MRSIPDCATWNASRSKGFRNTFGIFGVCACFLVKWKYKIRILTCHIQMIEPNQAGLAPSALDEVRFYCRAVSPYPHHHPSSPQKEWSIIPRIISEWIFSMRWIWNFFNYTTLKPMPFLRRFYADLGSIEAPGSRQSISKLEFLEVTTITMRLWIDIHQEDKNIKTDSFHHFWTLTPTDFVTKLQLYESHQWPFQQLEHLYGFFQGQDLDGKLRRAASADELAERLKEARRGRRCFFFLMRNPRMFFFFGNLDFQQTIWAFGFFGRGSFEAIFFPQQLTNVSWKE